MDNIDKTVQLVTVIATIITLAIALISAATSARSSALTELRGIVEDLKESLIKSEKTIDSLQKEFQRERRRRMQYEDYIHALLMQMRQNGIEPLDMSKYVFAQDEKEDSSL